MVRKALVCSALNALYGITSAPGESELYNIFCQALELANGRSIIVRTMDIGGDKPVDYLNIPARSLTRSSVIARCVFMKNMPRCSPHNYGRFLRASAHGSLKIDATFG